MRGHRPAVRGCAPVTGSIPACAGSPRIRLIRGSRDWVYPRVCGVTSFSGGWAPPVEGLSPRVRGHRLYNSVEYGRDGSIPACAGSPDHAGGVEARAQVYPRVCGVTSAAAKARAIARGLSPRVRGHRYWHYRRGRKDRSIPACAGSPSGARQPRPNAEVYPRVCGVTPNPTLSAIVIGGLSPRVRGHLSKAYEKAVSAGSIPACAGSPQRQRVRGGSGEVYPRVCGVTQPAAGVSVGLTGLSPRVRGHPLENPVIVPRFGSIPACAGSPAALRPERPVGKVYPRVCGVTFTPLYPLSPIPGLSPRVRGHRRPTPARPARAGSIPACAGSPSPSTCFSATEEVYPRVCGVTYNAATGSARCCGLSPRVRGHLSCPRPSQGRSGSIPACAGSPGKATGVGGSSRVYPRVCGVTGNSFEPDDDLPGLSPRVRGHLGADVEVVTGIGSIPACAGSPANGRLSYARGEVYPRVCGVTLGAEARPPIRRGLSPRVRGHPVPTLSVLAGARSIPACAGSPCPNCSDRLAKRVYPRVCGVTAASRHRPASR